MQKIMNKKVENLLFKFKILYNTDKLFVVSMLLHHMDKGLINDGNYMNRDQAYANNKFVLEANQVNLDNPMKLAIKLLMVGNNLKSPTTNSNRLDIEPFINKMDILSPILVGFYNLNIKEKIDFLIESIYDISKIKEITKLDFNFNKLIRNLKNYSEDKFEKKYSKILKER